MEYLMEGNNCINYPIDNVFFLKKTRLKIKEEYIASSTKNTDFLKKYIKRMP